MMAKNVMVIRVLYGDDVLEQDISFEIDTENEINLGDARVEVSINLEKTKANFNRAVADGLRDLANRIERHGD